MAIQLVFETHAMTLDNEQGHATGWLPGWRPWPELGEWIKLKRELDARKTEDEAE